ncbi:MAG: HAD-IC family P-type ATPase, partial [Clostridiales bacterium]|nr:HAD-IC family P-type ATPase [Clostridiales bacterium]
MNDNNKYKGLTGFEAQERLMRYGKNVISNHKRKSALGIFLAQFADFMVMILIICTIISAIMGDVIESYVIIAIVIINAILGFAQEFKTEKTMEALKGLTAPKARVLRDGSTVTIPAERVVPGDIAFLNAGDRIPADGRILDCTGMSLDESMLTGESMPVQKEEGFLFSGTLLLTGHGTIKVVSTGMNTEMGKIAGMIQEVKETETPLQKRLSRLGVFIIIGCLIICAIVAITGVLRGEPAFSMLLTGISLAVAAVPEGLPAIVTISLAMGVQRMMARNALVRKLPAVETLGSTNIICSDKTGTLTQNKMTVRIMTTISEILAAHAYKDPVDLIKVKEICLTCSNSSDPTERALEEAAGDINIEGVYNRIGENPFDSKRKCMSVIVENKIGEKYIFAKGAVDVLLEKCIGYQQAGRQYSLEPGMKHKTAQYCNTLAQDALRVLGMAYRKLGPGENINLGEKLEKNLIMTGVAGLIDPPRPEVAEAVTMCRSAGIRTVMITGDHKATATAIGKELDILRKGDKVMTGDELEHTGDEELARQIPKISIFARVMPAHKLRIVKTLKKLGNIVAMTGDGVNDAPAVKEADIGVSMGINGTDVTREASSMVLLDDNFATIVAAIVQGREIYDNIKKFIRYMLTCN